MLCFVFDSVDHAIVLDHLSNVFGITDSSLVPIIPD